jgi:hypothetical protein
MEAADSGRGRLTVIAGRIYPKRHVIGLRRFIPIKYMYRYTNGIRRPRGTLLPQPYWLPKYLAALYRCGKRQNWFAVRDFSRRSDKRFAMGGHYTLPDCPKNFWGLPY